MKSFLISFLVFVLPLFVLSQNPVSVKEVSLNMSKGVQHGFEVEIPYASAKEVKKDWKHRLTAGNKAKQSEGNGEVAIKGIDNKDIAGALFNVYAIVTATDHGVKLTAFFTYNDTTFFTTQSGKSEASAASKLVRDFGGAEYYLAVKSSYHTEREKLEKLKDELEKNIRIEEKSALKITENKRAIARAQDDLATNENDLKEATAAVNLQQAEVNKARSGNADLFKAADKALKELQDAEKKLKNHSEDLHKKIDNWNKDNTTEERAVTMAKQDQAKNTDAIEKQKLLIKELAAKLKGIRLL